MDIYKEAFDIIDAQYPGLFKLVVPEIGECKIAFAANKAIDKDTERFVHDILLQAMRIDESCIDRSGNGNHLSIGNEYEVDK